MAFLSEIFRRGGGEGGVLKSSQFYILSRAFQKNACNLYEKPSCEDLIFFIRKYDRNDCDAHFVLSLGGKVNNNKRCVCGGGG